MKELSKGSFGGVAGVLSCASALLLSACTHNDPIRYLDVEATLLYRGKTIVDHIPVECRIVTSFSGGQLVTKPTSELATRLPDNSVVIFRQEKDICKYIELKIQSAGLLHYRDNVRARGTTLTIERLSGWMNLPQMQATWMDDAKRPRTIEVYFGVPSPQSEAEVKPLGFRVREVKPAISFFSRRPSAEFASRAPFWSARSRLRSGGMDSDGRFWCGGAYRVVNAKTRLEAFDSPQNKGLRTDGLARAPREPGIIGGGTLIVPNFMNDTGPWSLRAVNGAVLPLALSSSGEWKLDRNPARQGILVFIKFKKDSPNLHYFNDFGQKFPIDEKVIAENQRSELLYPEYFCKGWLPLPKADAGS